jgi:hypothetical protein
MSGNVIVGGDTATFNLPTGVATVSPLSTSIPGTGHATIGGSQVCIKGDEENVKLSCSYKTATYPTDGEGELSITNLCPDQVASYVSDGKHLILKGASTFEATMTVKTAASNSTAQDVVGNQYSTTGSFEPENTWVTVN